MIVQDINGNYIRLSTEVDVPILKEMYSDWRTAAMREGLREGIRNSLATNIIEKLSNPLPNTKPIILVYVLADETVVGSLMCQFISREESSISLLASAIHPSYRGAGHYSAFIRMFTWLVNEHLKIDKAFYEVFDDTVQVKNLASSIETKKMARGSNGKDLSYFDRALVNRNLNSFIGTSYTSPLPSISLEDRYILNGRNNIASLELNWIIHGEVSRNRLEKMPR